MENTVAGIPSSCAFSAATWGAKYGVRAVPPPAAGYQRCTDSYRTRRVGANGSTRDVSTRRIAVTPTA